MEIENFKRDLLKIAKCDLSTFAKTCFIWTFSVRSYFIHAEASIINLFLIKKMSLA